MTLVAMIYKFIGAPIDWVELVPFIYFDLALILSVALIGKIIKECNKHDN